jgi:hypothetical protein
MSGKIVNATSELFTELTKYESTSIIDLLAVDFKQKSSLIVYFGAFLQLVSIF